MGITQWIAYHVSKSSENVKTDFCINICTLIIRFKLFKRGSVPGLYFHLLEKLIIIINLIAYL